MQGYFETCKIPVICQVMQMKQDGKLKDKTNLQFAFDLQTAAYKFHENYTQDDGNPFENQTEFL